jgi:hypothetical protein
MASSSWPTRVSQALADTHCGGGPLRAALAKLGADPGADLGFHEFSGHPGHAVAQHVGVLVLEQLVGELGSGHPVALGHRDVSFVALLEQTDDHEARGGRTHIRPASLLHHSPRLDLLRPRMPRA